MNFGDAISWLRSDQNRKLRRQAWAPGLFYQWFTTPETTGFKDQAGTVIVNISVEDILAEDWEKFDV